MTKLYILLLLLLISIYLFDAIELQISNGHLEGKTVLMNNMTLHMFKRIPFAQKPLGKLRFQKPQPIKNWIGILNATEYGDACLGIRSNSDHPITMSEDCLNINVFTSDFCFQYNGGCPVFVMIHGGVFAFGNSIQYNDTQILEKFVKHNIIFVLPAMRVGFFGFADFGEDYDSAPYNVGLHDIIANLEWIQNNIHNFGGDSQKVTLMGYSAGGVTTQYMISSPQLQNRRLFSRAMISSGLPMLAPEQCRNLTDVFTQMAKCSKDPITNQTLSIQQKLHCLRNKSANELNELTIQIKDKLFHFGPQTSRNLLPARNYLELATNRKSLPLLVITALTELENVYDTINSIQHVCTDRLNVLNLYQEETINECVKRYNDTTKLSSDFYHAIAALECRFNNNHNLASPCYLGVFAQINHSNHANDMLYLVGQHLGKVKQFTLNDMLMDDFYPQVVRNFVNGKQPSEDWHSTDKKGKGYLNMNFDVLSPNKKWPEFVENEWYEEDSVSFFLDYLFEVERNASKSALFHDNSRNLSLFSTRNNNSTTSTVYNNHSLYHRLYNFILLQTFIVFSLIALLFIVLIKLKQRRSHNHLLVSNTMQKRQYEYGAV